MVEQQMKILVFSDTHGLTASAVRAANAHADADEIIHLGDNVRDAREIERLTGKPVTFVRGNCDYSPEPEKLLITKGGCRIFLTHGHRYGVGFSLLRLALAAEEAGAQAALFGHTHKSLLEYENCILLLNPGSTSCPRGCVPSYALIEAEGGRIKAEIISAD